MKDIDFDELDKAVNSLMSGIPKTVPAKSDDVKTLTLDMKPTDDTSFTPKILSTSSTTAVRPMSEQTSEKAQSVSVPSTAPTMPLASRRGGRFMDVVHSSSDMKKSMSSQAPSRQGLTIEPRARMPQTPVVADTTLVKQPEATATATRSSLTPVVTTQNDTNTTNDWPDPLEISLQKPEAEDVPDKSTKVTEDETVTTSEQVAVEQTAPLTSPFLAGAKVEKRPLGGSYQTTPPEEAEEPDHAPVLGALAQEDTANVRVDNQRPPEPVEAEAPIPEELSGDLMAIESGSRQVNESTEEALAVEQEEPSISIASTSAVTEQKSNGPSSISQQYKEEPSTGDQTSGSIFDTAAYHQPLAHPAKHKSGWLWVIGVIAVLLLGAASGAALYYLGLV